MRTPQSIIKRPLLTEKSARLRETGGAAQAPAEGTDVAQQIVFEVAPDANKIEIRQAIQSLFKVSVTGVRTLIVRGKVKRVGRDLGLRRPRGPLRAATFAGRRPGMKKAYVTLKPGDNISFFEGV